MELNKRIREFIIEEGLAGDRTIVFTDDDSFLERGLIDSTGVLELIVFVEEQFGIAVRDEDLVPENFDSVEKLSRYISLKLAEANQGNASQRPAGGL